MDMDPPIGLDEFAAFITDRWGGRPCECCGQRAWTFGENTHKQLAGFMMIVEDGKFDYGRSRVGSVYLTVCKYCGNVRFITRPILEAWVQNLRAQPQPSNLVPGPGFGRETPED